MTSYGMFILINLIKSIRSLTFRLSVVVVVGVGRVPKNIFNINVIILSIFYNLNQVWIRLTVANIC